MNPSLSALVDRHFPRCKRCDRDKSTARCLENEANDKARELVAALLAVERGTDTGCARCKHGAGYHEAMFGVVSPCRVKDCDCTDYVYREDERGTALSTHIKNISYTCGCSHAVRYAHCPRHPMGTPW